MISHDSIHRCCLKKLQAHHYLLLIYCCQYVLFVQTLFKYFCTKKYASCCRITIKVLQNHCSSLESPFAIRSKWEFCITSLLGNSLRRDFHLTLRNVGKYRMMFAFLLSFVVIFVSFPNRQKIWMRSQIFQSFHSRNS